MAGAGKFKRNRYVQPRKMMVSAICVWFLEADMLAIYA
jgi:hypothetical protein